MLNPKTTLPGYLILAASVLSFAAKILAGGVDAAAIQDILAALAGIGLISARDGGH
ncbi:MAG: hypothetical protein HYZ11_03900 [Candidatus Tectomicrobia bacterium]|uniref:Holin n=1 Tax=Tectimicrobiota bacterium TaxID=2528274 RepID=A0A932ML31_UNCTE|nr:hypothetical protein [Candidatus Tectomicrobia bacterium]